MAFASPLQRAAVIGQDHDEQRAGSDQRGQGDLREKSPTFAGASDTSPSAGVDFAPAVGRTASVESNIVGDAEGARCDSGDASRNSSESDPVSDPESEAPRAAEALSLSSGALGDVHGSSEEAVAAEDWLEVTHAMMGQQ